MNQSNKALPIRQYRSARPLRVYPSAPDSGPLTFISLDVGPRPWPPMVHLPKFVRLQIEGSCSL